MKNNTFKAGILFCVIALFNNCNNVKPGVTDPISGDVFNTQYDKVNAKQVDTIQLPQYATLSVKMKETSFDRLTTTVSFCKLPEHNGDLNGRFEKILYKFDKNLTSSANVLGYKGTVKENQILYMLDFTKSVMINCNGQKKYGIGLRLFVLVSNIYKPFPSNLEMAASATDNDKTTVTYEFKSLGSWQEQDIMNELPSTGDFNLNVFNQISVAYIKMENIVLSGTNFAITTVQLPN